MRAIVRRAEGPRALLPGSIHNPDHEPPPCAAQKYPTSLKRIQGRISYPRSNLHRGHLAAVEKPRQRTERRINTVTLDLVDDMQPDLRLLPGIANVSDTKNHRGRARMNLSWSGYFIRSFDQIRDWWNSIERNASRGIISVPLNLLNPLRHDRPNTNIEPRSALLYFK